jgi:predicted GIY-YIG superfamily endonuclease
MNPSTPPFSIYLAAVHQAYQKLLTAPLHPAMEHPTIPSSGGVYVFYEKGQPFYVGRTRNLRRRLRQHSHPTATHFSASFAFLMARRLAALPAIPKLTRDQTAQQLDSLFSLCRQRVSYMSVRWVSEEEPIIQSLLEVYAAVTLQTTERFNSFRTT